MTQTPTLDEDMVAEIKDRLRDRGASPTNEQCSFFLKYIRELRDVLDGDFPRELTLKRRLVLDELNHFAALLMRENDKRALKTTGGEPDPFRVDVRILQGDDEPVWQSHAVITDARHMQVSRPVWDASWQLLKRTAEETLWPSSKSETEEKTK